MKQVSTPKKILFYCVDGMTYEASKTIWPYFNLIFTRHYTSSTYNAEAITRMLIGDASIKFPQSTNLAKTVADTPNLIDYKTIGGVMKDKKYLTAGIIEGGFLSHKMGLGKKDKYDLWHESWSYDAGKIFNPEFFMSKKEFRFLHDGFIEYFHQDIKNKPTKPVVLDKDHTFLKLKDSKFEGDSLKDLERKYWARVNMVGEIMRWVEGNKKDIIIVTSSRGYSFNDEDGVMGNYAQKPIQEITHVPLLIKYPGMKYQKFSHLTTEVDITATLYDLVGDKFPFEGHSLFKHYHRNYLLFEYFQPPDKTWRVEITPNSYLIFPK
jgi:hypothetical protein